MIGRQVYESVQMDTVPQEHIVTTVLERAIVHVHRAEGAIAARRAAEAHDALTRAQVAVLSLRTALVREKFPELAENLERLFNHVLGRLTEANVQKDASHLPEVAEILNTLADAWREAEKITPRPLGGDVA